MMNYWMYPLNNQNTHIYSLAHFAPDKQNMYKMIYRFTGFDYHILFLKKSLLKCIIFLFLHFYFLYVHVLLEHELFFQPMLRKTILTSRRFTWFHYKHCPRREYHLIIEGYHIFHVSTTVILLTMISLWIWW